MAAGHTETPLDNRAITGSNSSGVNFASNDEANQCSKKRLRILHLLLTTNQTSAPYNEHCLAAAAKRDITVCSLFKSAVETPSAISFYEGDNTLRGFIRIVREALAQHEFDVVHAHSPHVAALYLWATLFRTKKRIPPAVFTVHTSWPNCKLRNRLLLIPVFAFFNRIVGCCNASRDSFPFHFRWLAGDRLRSVPNGVDLARIESAVNVCDSRRACFTVVSVGRLIELKNPLTLWAAFQISADESSRMCFVGEGPLGDRILDVGDAAGLASRLELTGLVPREKVYEYLVGASLFVSASRVEGLPVSVLEAMACGCPVVLSDIPSHREIVDGVDFIPLIPPDDIDGFAKQIKRFRLMTSQEREVIGAQCRKHVEQRFSLKVMNRNYLQIYRQLIGGPSARRPLEAAASSNCQ